MTSDIIKDSNIQVLAQLEDLLLQLNNAQYASPLSLLNGNSLGKHVRHVLELYLEFFNGLELAEVSYDLRKRNPVLENEVSLAIEHIALFNQKLMRPLPDAAMQVRASFEGNAEVLLNSSTLRELAYNLEHAIHHMAIIQICIQHHFPEITIPKDFGVAYATRKYLNKHVHTNVSASE